MRWKKSVSTSNRSLASGPGSYASTMAPAAHPISALAWERASSMCRAEFEGMSSKTSTIRYRPSGP
ncbi:hypothetical protein [Streptomyces hydrogenans]|uniref:hypothetical protein n=1 Tax=Streptomyces hydrogenans TaxID=1873719 RepID=UPI0035D9FE86